MLAKKRATVVHINMHSYVQQMQIGVVGRVRVLLLLLGPMSDYATTTPRKSTCVHGKTADTAQKYGVTSNPIYPYC